MRKANPENMLLVREYLTEAEAKGATEDQIYENVYSSMVILTDSSQARTGVLTRTLNEMVANGEIYYLASEKWPLGNYFIQGKGPLYATKETTSRVLTTPALAYVDDYDVEYPVNRSPVFVPSELHMSPWRFEKSAYETAESVNGPWYPIASPGPILVTIDQHVIPYGWNLIAPFLRVLKKNGSPHKAHAQVYKVGDGHIINVRQLLDLSWVKS